jgi:hypothetical protein
MADTSGPLWPVQHNASSVKLPGNLKYKRLVHEEYIVASEVMIGLETYARYLMERFRFDDWVC